MALVSRTDYLLEASKANAHWLLSGFKNFEISTFIYKPDRMKNETFSVPGPCRSVHFLSFCNFDFQLAHIAPQFLVIKVPRDLSKFTNYVKLRNNVGSFDPNYRE